MKSIFYRVKNFWKSEWKGDGSPYVLSNAVSLASIALMQPVFQLPKSVWLQIIFAIVFCLVVGAISLAIFCKIKNCTEKTRIPARRFWLMLPLVVALTFGLEWGFDLCPQENVISWILYGIASILLLIFFQFLALVKSK